MIEAAIGRVRVRYGSGGPPSGLVGTRPDHGDVGTPLTGAELPADNEPSPRDSVGGDHPGWGSRQPMWTGHEAVVFAGFAATGALLDGSTYQPPVGCVCPSADAEACDGVTALPHPNLCAPM